VSAAEDYRVDALVRDRLEVLAGHIEELLAARHAGLDEFDEARARLAHHLDVRGRGEGVDIRL
jgi:hypothetical protein